MVREISAGGVVVRRMRGRWWLAAIVPQGRLHRPVSGRQKTVLALPKGLVDPGERPEQTAAREVHEESGVTGELVRKLGDIKYVYTRSFGDGAKVFKIVSFFLLRYRSGRLGDIPPEMRHEVSRAQWLPLEEAPGRLSYRGERDMAAKALAYLRNAEGP